jgi:hypothetical protein
MQRGMLYCGRVDMQRGMKNNFADLVKSFYALHKDETFGLRRKANNRAS